MSKLLNGTVVCFQSMPATVSGKWNLLFPRGPAHGPNLKPIGGSINIDDALMAQMLANWKAMGGTPLPVRKTHEHLDASDPVEKLTLEEAYGFITDLRVTPAGFEALVEWNAAGEEAVKSGKWAFWSAEWLAGRQSRATGEVLPGWSLIGAALTNTPFFNSLPPLAASQAAVNEGTNQPQEKKPMEELFKSINDALANAGDNKAAVLAGIQAILAQNGGSGEEPGEMDAAAPMPPPPPVPPVDVTAAVSAAVKDVEKAFTARLAASEKQVEAMRKEVFARDFDAMLTRIKASRSIPGDRIIALAKREAESQGMAAAEKVLLEATVAVPTKALGITGSEGEKRMSASEARVEYTKVMDEAIKSGKRAAEAAHFVNSTRPELVAILYPNTIKAEQ